MADGGEVRMPLGAYPFSKLYGWVEDRFGVNWQLMLADPGAERRPMLMPQFLFTGPAAQARQAIDLYTGLLPDSGTGMLVPQPADPDAVMFAEFRLAGQWFSAMDGGTAHDFTFTPGLSLEVNCAGQEEIDALWEVLSAVPEAEQCGWSVDRFGVSWQIVPDNMGELMQKPGAYQRMLDMKKIIIAEL
ncbi:VOC family protein [Arthrobacter sp. SDTb3-6]|uniref:VOC family protein n=1 Tax=Arthrobacter sp. SDTb3-6 TaxID=2713571 RepID=UPI0021088D9A|nr:VOC family protein [Arthrobacter sp. SDTb3-6]